MYLLKKTLRADPSTFVAGNGLLDSPEWWSVPVLIPIMPASSCGGERLGFCPGAA